MWFIIALIVGGGVVGLALWLRSQGVKISWYEWLIGIVGLGLLLFAVQNYIGFTAELEPSAPGLVLLVMGLPALVLIAIAGLLIWKRQRSAG
jgi:hypothetical protein